MAKAVTSPKDGFSLADLIESAANELREAHKRPREGDPVMEFKGCELELAVTVKGEAGAGIRFWVVDASTKVAAERVSKIKLSFGAISDGPAMAFPAPEEGPGPANPKREGA